VFRPAGQLPEYFGGTKRTQVRSSDRLGGEFAFSARGSGICWQTSAFGQDECSAELAANWVTATNRATKVGQPPSGRQSAQHLTSRATGVVRGKKRLIKPDTRAGVQGANRFLLDLGRPDARSRQAGLLLHGHASWRSAGRSR